MRKYFQFAILFLSAMVSPFDAHALQPEEIVVIANKSVHDSVELAEYYMERRGIPKENLIQVWVKDQETCSREDYRRRVLEPVREFLQERHDRLPVRCLVTMYGMPLRIKAPAPSPEERWELDKLKIEKKQLEAELKISASWSEAEKDEAKKRIAELGEAITKFAKGNEGAALDSEIALVRARDYPLAMWVPNPFFVGFQKETLAIGKDDVLMVSRLDGPSEEIVRRIIDDSIEVEEKGLKGKAYFDARWAKPSKKQLEGYALYDNSIHRAAEALAESESMPVVLDEKSELFQPGDCPEAALYCGWYSLARYVDAFEWRKGAIGYHIASSECHTLKGKKSQAWCKRMLEEGVAATVGPVAEPYVQAFPVPEAFFSLLADGYYSLAEAYVLSTPYLSWQMVLVGDPLYRPFKNQ